MLINMIYFWFFDVAICWQGTVFTGFLGLVRHHVKMILYYVTRSAGVRPDKSLTSFDIRLYRHYRIVHGVRIALAFVLTFLVVRLLDVPEGSWPLITMVVVMGPLSFLGNVLPRAVDRIGGTILGAVL